MVKTAGNPGNAFFWALCIMGLFAILSSTMAKNPVLNPFAKSLGTPESLIGVVAAASTIPGIIVSLPAGSLSDIFGRRKVLLASSIVFASAPFLYLLVVSWWQLILVRFYHGFATAIFIPVANAAIAGLFPVKRGERISTFSSATIVGRSIAPFLGGYILFVTSYNYHELYAAVGVAGTLALFTALIFLRAESEKPSAHVSPKTMGKGGISIIFHDWKRVAKNRGVIVVSIVEAAQYYTFGAVEFFLVGYLKDVARLDPFSIGIVSGAQLVIIPIAKPFMGKLSDRVGRGIPIVAGSVIGGLPLILIPFVTEFPLLLLISVTYGLGFSLVTSSTPALVGDLVRKELYGTAMGFLATIMDVGQTLGPIITGLIIAISATYTSPFAVLAGILLISCAVFLASKVAKANSI